MTSYRLVDFGSATGVAGCVWGQSHEDEGCLLHHYGEDTLAKLDTVFRSVASSALTTARSDRWMSEREMREQLREQRRGLEEMREHVKEQQLQNGGQPAAEGLRIRSADLAQCFRAVGAKPQEDEIARLINKYDKDNKGVITAEEFYNMFGELVASQVVGKVSVCVGVCRCPSVACP